MDIRQYFINYYIRPSWPKSLDNTENANVVTAAHDTVFHFSSHLAIKDVH